MAVSYWDPRAGSPAARADFVTKCRRIAKGRLSAAVKDAAGHRCESCGSKEYAATNSGVVCSYCRSPRATKRDMPSYAGFATDQWE